jgi:hypothetical protein
MVLGWSANIRKLDKNHKGYGSAAKELIACLKTVQYTQTDTNNVRRV